MSELTQLLELAERRVRSAEGAKLYGKPIGSVIGSVDDDSGQAKRPMTIERIKSLQEQFETAKKTGNTALMKDVQREFSKAVAEYRASRQDVNVLRELTGERGRQAQAVQKGDAPESS